jgi:hypothetical protein
MSEIRVNDVVSEDGVGPVGFSKGINISSGVVTATTFVGTLTGSATNASGLTGTPNITVADISSTNIVASAATITGNLTVQGTQTVINTDVLEVVDKNIGIGSTSSASDTTADGAGITIYGSTDGTNNKTLTWEKDTGCFEVNNPFKFKGVVETVSVANTYTTASGQTLLEMDLAAGTVFTYTQPTPNGTIGIVSFKNMPADTGVQNVVTVSCIFTQMSTDPAAGGAITLGIGNTAAITGIGTSCSVVGYEDGVAVAGITTVALVGSGTTVTLSDIADRKDIVSFMIHYNGGTNTAVDSYQVYATKGAAGIWQGHIGG